MIKLKVKDKRIPAPWRLPEGLIRRIEALAERESKKHKLAGDDALKPTQVAETLLDSALKDAEVNGLEIELA